MNALWFEEYHAHNAFRNIQLGQSMDHRARNSRNFISKDFCQTEIAKIDRYEVYI